MAILKRAFYDRDAVVVAQELLGKILVYEVNGYKLTARIVETEAYMGIEDKAAHSYGGRKTNRVAVMYGKPGFVYIFMIYGMYFCFNIVTREEGIPQAVLIRAVEPLEGLEEMAHHRFQKEYWQLTPQQKKALTNGPGKLCKAFSIDKKLNGSDVCGNTIYIKDGKQDTVDIVEAKRVGIDYAQEAAEFLWRFYIKDNLYVSVA